MRLLLYSLVTALIFTFTSCGASSSNKTTSEERSPSTNLASPNNEKVNPAPVQQKILKMEPCNLPVPNDIQLLDGSKSHLHPAENQNATLLYIWASYTPSLQKDVSLLQELQRIESGTDLHIISLNVGDYPAAIGRAVSEHNILVPVAVDPDGELNKAIGIDAVPCLYIISKKGLAVRNRLGPLTDVDIEGAITDVINK